MTSLSVNVGSTERLLSVLGGIYLLNDAIRKKEVNPRQTMAGSYLLLRGATGFCLVYRVLGKTKADYKPANINIKTAVTVNRPRDQVFAFWRKLENLPSFMKHLRRVQVLNDTMSEWTAIVPGHLGTLSWKSEIVKDDPGNLLSWQSLPGSFVDNAGKVTFLDAGKFGTEVHLVISYRAPLGLVGERAAKLINPVFETMVKDDVRNFKRYIETGEIPTIQGQASGRRKSLLPIGR